MVKDALGLMEIVGLAAAIEAADAAVKAANIKLIGYELTKGGGLIVVKFSGDVGAVTAAVQAGKIAASKVNKVWATHVIPRPHGQISCILETKETIGLQENNVLGVSESSIVTVLDEAIIKENEVQPEIESPKDDKDKKPLDNGDELPSVEQPKNLAVSCNLCGDPACARVKGDPKIACIHYEKNNKEE